MDPSAGGHGGKRKALDAIRGHMSAGAEGDRPSVGGEDWSHGSGTPTLLVDIFFFLMTYVLETGGDNTESRIKAIPRVTAPQGSPGGGEVRLRRLEGCPGDRSS